MAQRVCEREGVKVGVSRAVSSDEEVRLTGPVSGFLNSSYSSFRFVWMRRGQ